MGTKHSKTGFKKNFSNPEAVKALTYGNMKVAFDLYKAITSAQREGTNSFFSPLSITVALSMTNVGARGNTVAELKKALKLDVLKEDQDVHSAFQEIMKTLSSDTSNLPFTLCMANRIYVEQRYKMADEFLSTLVEKYSAAAVATSFAKKPDQARLEINAWVEQVTRNKITDLLSGGSISNLSRAILVNAIYFKGTWKSQFDTKNSCDGEFFRTATDKITTRMMKQEFVLPFADVNKFGCKVLELPYTGDRLSMIVVLPHEVDGLAALEANMVAKCFRVIVSSLKENIVNVTLPKFKLELGSAIKPILENLGIVDAFSEGKADFSGMTGNVNDLYVSDVFHKAFVDVNEEGTEAAACGADYFREYSLGDPPPPPPVYYFVADHPFLFAIYDRLTTMVLFLGRLTDPAAS